MVESNKQKIRSVLTLLTFQNEKDEMFFKLDRCTFFKRGISFIENLLGYYKHIFVYLFHSNNNSWFYTTKMVKFFLKPFYTVNIASFSYQKYILVFLSFKTNLIIFWLPWRTKGGIVWIWCRVVFKRIELSGVLILFVLELGHDLVSTRPLFGTALVLPWHCPDCALLLPWLCPVSDLAVTWLWSGFELDLNLPWPCF